MSDFSGLELSVDKPFRLVLTHPISRQPLRDAEGKEAYIDHYSDDCEIARKHQRAVTRRRLNQRGRVKLTPEEIEAEAVELLAALTAGWHLVDLKGNRIDIPFSQEKAKALYANPAVSWLREQLDESASDRANFSQGSSTS